MTTPTNNPARAATVGELAKFRAGGQASQFGIVIHKPVTVYSARINQTFDTLDAVIELTYDGGSGTLANVKEGMTVFIGSTAGAHDKGITCIRKTPSGTKFYIRPTSNISFADNDHITVVDAFAIWGKPIYNNGGVILMDTDIELGDLTRGGVIPRLGPIAAVMQKASGTLTFEPPNPSQSAGYDGATISGYEFEAPGASTTSNLTSATSASWTYPLTADGAYRWNCNITDSLGRETVSYRRVFVNPSEVPFKLQRVKGDFDSGGWSFEVTAYADVDDIYDGALVVLYTKDYHGGAVENIGKLAGFENVLACGWIDGESIEQDDQTGWVSFTVQGPHFWMDKAHVDAFELTDTFDTPTTWNQVQELTVDKALAHVLYWMTTAPLLMDCFFTGDTQRVRSLPIAGGSLWQTLKSLAADKIFAPPACNNYGQLFVQVDQQIADSTARASFPVVLDLTSEDYMPPLELVRTQLTKTAMLQLGALQNADGVTDIFLYSRAPGNAPLQYGGMSTYENYIVEDASECRRIAGQLLALENQPYDRLEIALPSSIRLFDIAPRMVATITTASGDNPRGTALTAQRLIPRTVEYQLNDTTPRTIVSFELEVTGVDGVDYYPPTVEEPNIDEGLEDFSGVDFPAMDTVFAETVPPQVTTPCNRNLGNSFTLTWSPRTITGSTSKRIARAYFPCMIRAGGGIAGNTHIIINYHAFGDAETHKTCYAVNGETRVLTGSWVGDVISFTPVSDTEITGFEIEIDAGAGSVVSRYRRGKFLESGIMNQTTTQCVSGKWYAIEPYKGYWENLVFPPGNSYKYYNFYIPPGSSFSNAGVGLDGEGDFNLNLVNGRYAEAARATETFNTGTQEFDYDPGLYGRIYFLAGGNITPTISASNFAPGEAQIIDMEWALYEAEAIGRQLVLGVSTLYNVCKIEAA